MKGCVTKSRIFLLFSPVFLILASCSLAADVTPPPSYVQPVVEPVSTEEPLDIDAEMLLAPNLLEGEEIYVEKCAPCHGPEGKGDGSLADRLPEPVPAIGDPGVALKSSPLAWYQIVTQGRMEKQMPPFNSLSDQQRWNVVAYLYTLSSSLERMDSGERLYLDNCVTCHSGNGNEVDAESKQASGESLTNESLNLTNLERVTDLSGEEIFRLISSGVGDSMPAFGDKLSEEDIWILTEYIRSLSFHVPGYKSEITNLQDERENQTGEAGPEILDTENLAEEGTFGTISGTVTNKSGGDIPGGLDVMLHGFDGMQQVYTGTVQLDEVPSGTGEHVFSFDEVLIVPGRAYLAVVEYEGVTYASDIVLFDEGKNSLELPIEIYESTSDASKLLIERLHLFLEPVDDRRIRVVALYILTNPGNSVIVASSEAEPALYFDLPEGAENLEFRDGELGGRFVPTNDGFGDLASIRPGVGSHQILLAYELELDRKLELSQRVELPVKAVVVLVPEDGINVRGETIQDEGVREMDGFNYHTYNGSSIAAGESLDLVISRASSFSLAQLSSGSSTSLVVGAAVFLMALLTAGVLLNRRNRQTEDEIEDESGDETQVEMIAQVNGSEDDIIDAILALDDLYKAGQLPEEAYHQRREELKDRLRKLRGDIS